MRRIVKCCICILLMLGMIVGCHTASTPQRSYKIGDPLDNGIVYLDINTVTQKKSLSLNEKEYLPKKGKVYIVFDVTISCEDSFMDRTGIDLNRATYSSDYANNGDYMLNTELSELASNLSNNEWSEFVSSTKKQIQLVFEGPETPENMKSETFYLEQPFVIYKEDIVVE